MIRNFLLLTTLFGFNAIADIQQDIENIETQMLEWRRHIHQHPELSNREYKTAEYVASHLKSLGMKVETGIAFTGVVGILEGDQPGPLLALRADMDALPVTEQVDLPFASKVTAEYRGEPVGVMHACGHDTHVAILMAVAEVFANNTDQLAGTLMFIFQPAEEGAPGDEEGGAELMLAEGLFKDMKPEAAFGLHVTSSMPSGVIGYRQGPMMAAVDDFELTVIGQQTHGSRPWSGIDPIVTSAQIINSVQTIISRRTDVTKAPAVVSFGAIKGGIRNNIIPDDVTMVGTIRNFDMGIRDNIHHQLGHIIDHVAEANDAHVEFKINEGYPVTVNDPALGEKMLPSLVKVFGDRGVVDPGLITGAEDFSYFANEVPGLYFFMGVTPPDRDYTTAPTNHSPHFYVDESALLNGVRAFVQLVQDY
ncbi:amidohydrolase [Marinicella sediminis]|uniref:Amidohydrolase n=1 Tax=Marinicella sediminis TaxID=1792834 RepID=A0ABV7JD27_9GAMM|nr:amidohydrolase [Marinicella sediminis]